MPLETIYIARHGFRQGFDVPKSVTGTWRDPVLTALGQQQARELAAYFADNSIPIDLIFSSPYYRCLQTATYTADRLDKPILVEFGISEFFQTAIPGSGLHPRPPLATLLKPHFPRIDSDAHTPLLFAPQTGESHQGIHDRAAAFLRLLIAHVDEVYPDVKSVLLVSHAATVIALGRALMKDRERDVRAGTCSLSCYTRRSGQERAEDGIGEWECRLNGDCSFLTGGEQRNWSFDQEIEMEEAGILELLVDEEEEAAPTKSRL